MPTHRRGGSFSRVELLTQETSIILESSVKKLAHKRALCALLPKNLEGDEYLRALLRI
jgi:hypothetical protein